MKKTIAIAAVTLLVLASLIFGAFIAPSKKQPTNQSQMPDVLKSVAVASEDLSIPPRKDGLLKDGKLFLPEIPSEQSKQLTQIVQNGKKLFSVENCDCGCAYGNYVRDDFVVFQLGKKFFITITNSQAREDREDTIVYELTTKYEEDVPSWSEDNLRKVNPAGLEYFQFCGERIKDSFTKQQWTTVLKQ